MPTKTPKNIIGSQKSKKIVESAPKRQRRKDDRPGEIISAAIDIFTEFGFGSAKLEDVAKKAGVAKGTVFVYFPTKNDLFRAVAKYILSSHLSNVEPSAANSEQPFPEIVRMLLNQAAIMGESHLSNIGLLLIKESKAFPDLACMWHEEVVSKVMGLLMSAIERAQAKGEVRKGDARLFAFSIIGPIFSGMIFRNIFMSANVELPNLRDLALQHADTILKGMLIEN